MGSTRSTRNSTMRPVGGSDLQQFNGYIRDDFLAELNGSSAYKNYDEMRRNSPIVGSLLYAIRMSLHALDFYFASDDGEEDPRVELLNESLAAMVHTWSDHLDEVMTMLPFGFAPFSINYQRMDGRVYWKKFKFLAQDTVMRWDIDEDDDIAALRQWTYIFPDPIPWDRLLLYRINVERNNPEGRSMLRTAYIPYYYAKHLMEIEGIAFERNGAGFPVYKHPPTADTTDGSEDRQAAQTMLRNIRVDEQAGVELPSEAEFQFMSPGTGGAMMAQAIDGAIKRYESRMLMGALSQFLLLGQDRVGALATFEGGVDFFTLSIDALADMVAENWTRYAIPRLLRLNGMDATGLRMEHTPAGQTDLSALGDFLQKTVGYVTWTGEDEQWLRSVARLPEKDVSELEEDPNVDIIQQVLNEDDDMPDDMPDDAEQDDMSAAYFAADNAPDDRERRRLERVMQQRVQTFLNRQRRRVAKEARGVR